MDIKFGFCKLGLRTLNASTKCGMHRAPHWPTEGTPIQEMLFAGSVKYRYIQFRMYSPRYVLHQTTLCLRHRLLHSQV